MVSFDSRLALLLGVVYQWAGIDFHAHVLEFPEGLSDLASVHVALLHAKQTKHFPTGGKCDKHLASMSSTLLSSMSCSTFPALGANEKDVRAHPPTSGEKQRERSFQPAKLKKKHHPIPNVWPRIDAKLFEHTFNIGTILEELKAIRHRRFGLHSLSWQSRHGFVQRAGQGKCLSVGLFGEGDSSQGSHLSACKRVRLHIRWGGEIIFFQLNHSRQRLTSAQWSLNESCCFSETFQTERVLFPISSHLLAWALSRFHFNTSVNHRPGSASSNTLDAHAMTHTCSFLHSLTALNTSAL